MKTFLSYAHTDKVLFNKLRKQLNILVRAGVLELWCDYEVPPGGDIPQNIKDAMEQSGLFLLCISADFFWSDFIQSVELKHALARHNKGTAQVIPIILKPCDWQALDEVKGLKALPTDGKAITLWQPQDRGLADVALQLRNLIDLQGGTV